MAGDSYAVNFVRKRIVSGQQKQADFNFDEHLGGNYISIVPPTRGRPKPQPKKRKKGVLRQFKRANSRQLKQIMRGVGPETETKTRQLLRCPVSLPPKLHSIWCGYAAGVLDLAKFETGSNQLTPGVADRLETVLRMDLIGAHLRVMRSISTRQAGVEGIVVMETRNVFYIADSVSECTEEEYDDSDSDRVCDPVERSHRPRLHIVPKRGSVFLLLLNVPTLTGGPTRVAEITLNGNSLAFRPTDRTLRKWRLCNPGPIKTRTPALRTDLLRDILFQVDVPDL